MKVESHVRVDRDLLFAVASYGITFVRLIIAVLGAFMILRGDDVRFTVASVALIMALDYFDGATFNRSNFSALREWRIKRRIVDSVSDRLVIQIICIALLVKNFSFVWLFLPILTRELAISGYVSTQFAKGILVYPRSISKIACAMVGISVISFAVFPVGFTFMACAVMITLSGLALFDYIHRTQKYKAPRSPMAKLVRSLEEIS